MPIPDDYDGELGSYTEIRKVLNYVLQVGTDKHAGLPAREYVTVGEIVHDCEQVVGALLITETGIAEAITAPGPLFFQGGCPPVWRIIFNIEIVRCTPRMDEGGEPPKPTDLESDAQVRAMDTYLLQTAAKLRGDEHFGGVSCQITYPAPSGGFSATVGRYVVQVST